MPRKARETPLFFSHAIDLRHEFDLDRKGERWRENLLYVRYIFYLSLSHRRPHGPEVCSWSSLASRGPSLPIFLPAPSFARRFHLSHCVSYFARIEREREREEKREKDPRDHKRSIGPADRLVGGRQPAAKRKRSLPSAKDNRALPSFSLRLPRPDGCNFGQCISLRLIVRALEIILSRGRLLLITYIIFVTMRRRREINGEY